MIVSHYLFNTSPLFHLHCCLPNSSFRVAHSDHDNHSLFAHIHSFNKCVMSAHYVPLGLWQPTPAKPCPLTVHPCTERWTKPSLLSPPSLHTGIVFLKIMMVIVSPLKNLSRVCTLKFKMLQGLHLKSLSRPRVPSHLYLLVQKTMTHYQSQKSLELPAPPLYLKNCFLQCNARWPPEFLPPGIHTLCSTLPPHRTSEYDGMPLLRLGS